MLNIVEFFSGIGSQAKALKNLGLEINTLGTSEWDVHAIAAYDLIHNQGSMDIPEDIQQMTKEEILEILKKYTFSNSGKKELDYSSFKTYSEEALKRIYCSVRRNCNFVDISEVKGAEMPDEIDILTYSFPCQDLSNVGAFHGYNRGIDKDSGSRSSLLWQVGRILTEMKESNKSLPRFLLMENVPTLLSERHFGNFSTWICDLKSLGYVSKYYQLNASDFGLPQNRPRLLMISVFVGDDTEDTQLVLDYFRMKGESEVISDYKGSSYYREITVSELLRTDYTSQILLEEAVECTPNDTVSRRKIWDENPQIVLPGYKLNPEISVIRTITTKQDRNPNSGNLYFQSGIDGRSQFRYLTPRECMLFMGFTDEDYEALKYNNLEFHKGDSLFARDKVIRMAGNSIPVKLLEGVFLQIVKIDALISDFHKRKAKGLDAIERAELIKVIRSELFRRKIRCRQGDVIGPNGADIVYPKYNTAIYIADCFEYGHDCCSIHDDNVNSDYWRNWAAERRHMLVSQIDAAKSDGWQTIVIWYCELTNGKAYDTVTQIEMELKRNLATGRHIEVSNG